jgi:O-antigen/teichoic acid export membrane protein
VWSLVVGGNVGALATVILSHVALPGIRHRLCWEPEARRELFKFGKWITASTAFTFLATQGDRALLSTFVSITMVGVYSVASNMSQVLLNVASRLTNSVLFPVYSAWGREGPGKLREKMASVRAKTLVLFLLPACLLAVIGDPLIRFLYDSRYHEAGWMLPLMSVAMILHILTITVDPVLLATGDSYRHMLLTTFKGSVVFVSMAVGGYLHGVYGLLLGSIVGRALQYPLLVWSVRGKGAWMPLQDVCAVAGSGAFILAGRALVHGLM